MLKLRVRIEVDRRGQGFPVDALADFVSAANLFLAAVGDDIGLDTSTGSWMASDFGQSSLSFTAQFSGPVEPHKIGIFHAGFHGAESFGLAIVAHLAGLGSTIQDEHTIGLGFFHSDADDDPKEWLAITRARAMEAWQQLNRSEVKQPPARDLLEELLQPATDQGIFGRRRIPVPRAEPIPAADVSAVTDQLRVRVETVEGSVGGIQTRVGTLEERVSGIELNLKRMLAHIDQFIESVGTRMGVASPAITQTILGEDPLPPKPRRHFLWAGLVVLAAAFVLLLFLIWPSRSPEPAVVRQPPPASTPKPEPPPPTPPQPSPSDEASPLETAAMRPITVELRAESPSWMAVFLDGEKKVSRLLDAGQEASFEAKEELRVRLGNAAAVQVTWNGKSMGPGGPPGQVRLLRFTRSGHENLPVRLPIQD
jgi:hypothetical protein